MVMSPALPTASSNCKRQTRLLVREDGPYQQNRNCQTVTKIRSSAPDGVVDTKTDWPTNHRNITLTLTASRRKLVTAIRNCEGVSDQRGQKPLNTEPKESALLRDMN
jgi:hypothetical protein